MPEISLFYGIRAANPPHVTLATFPILLYDNPIFSQETV